MRVRKAYRFRLEPTIAVAREMSRVAGCCRYVFNRALALQKERFERREARLGYAAVCRELTTWRHARDTAFLADAPIHPLQQALQDLARAYRNFFEGRAEPPRFKKKGRRDAFRFPDPKQFAVDEVRCRVKLPKLGWIRYRASRPVSGTPKQITVSLDDGHWFVSIQTEQDVADPVHPAGGVVGLDLGVVKFAALSTGEIFAPVASFRTREKKLGHEQRKLARKAKFSANWRKQAERIAKVHAKIARVRNDFLHKTSTIVSKTHAVIVIEDLSVRAMSRSVRGTVDAPGRKVRAKARLNRSILDQGWAGFRRQLTYKQAWRGGRVVAVDPHDTSRTCARCGYIAAQNRIGQGAFQCLRCGHAADADVNAAHNILAAGHAVIACGEMARSGHSGKQEPSVSAALNRCPAGISGRKAGEDAKR